MDCEEIKKLLEEQGVAIKIPKKEDSLELHQNGSGSSDKCIFHISHRYIPDDRPLIIIEYEVPSRLKIIPVFPLELNSLFFLDDESYIVVLLQKVTTFFLNNSEYYYIDRAPIRDRILPVSVAGEWVLYHDEITPGRLLSTIDRAASVVFRRLPLVIEETMNDFVKKHERKSSKNNQEVI